MGIDQRLLTEASARKLLDPQQAGALRAMLTERGRDRPGFRPIHILYYSGGLLAIGAMSLFMNLGWQSFGGRGLLMIALSYACIGLLLTEYLLRRHTLPIPAGITATIVVVLTPLAVYGFQMEYQWLWWSEADELAFRDYHYTIDWRWQLMELATLLSGTFLLWRYRLPFLTMPIAVTLWYMSMDLAPYLFGPEYDSWLRRSMVSVGSGLLIIGLALGVDLRSRRGDKDYAFWFYLFGALAFWGGLSGMYWDRSIKEAGYLAGNLAMIATGALLLRPVFVVFGGLGMTTCLIHLAYRDYLFSLRFPFILTLIGMATIGLGVFCQRRGPALGARLNALLPAALRELIEKRAH